MTGAGDLFLDFRGGEVTRLIVNGRAVTPERPGHRILLPGDLLRATTEIEVAYENEYDHGGDGFHHFVDPEDGAEYAYSNFEPFEAHRLFPCFDQPDLKGTYAVTVRAPADWAIIANAPAGAVVPVGDGRREHRFAPTPPISSYLVAVIAGPFAGVHTRHRGTPLGIWTRRSLARFMDPDEVFEVTRQGLDFYAALFDHPFPFAKYDQIFVPEFNSGAMENVGAVTFSEHYVYRDPPTATQRLMRAETALHELAHMWFGDLATMRWWDDLWLNESFATYVSNLALAEATRFDGAWRAFHADMKRWGYQADARSTTHPVSGVVPDTDATFYNFDGITYGKGASVIKQLVAEIGPEAFRAGLRTYFRRHAWGNATLADFLAALEEGAGRPLARLEPALAGDGVPQHDRGRLDDARRAGRTAPADPGGARGPPDAPPACARAGPRAGARATGRPRSTWCRPASRVPRRGSRRPPAGRHRTSSSPTTAITGMPASCSTPPRWPPCRASSGRSTTRSCASSCGAPSGRWSGAPATRPLPSWSWSARTCPGSATTRSCWPRLDAARGALASYVPAERRVDEARGFVATALETIGTLPEGDLRTLWLRAAIGAVAAPADVAAVAAVVDQEPGMPRVQVDREMRWGVAALAVAHGLPGAAERVAAERAADPTDRGEREMLRAETGAPDAAVKAAAWERIHGRGLRVLPPHPGGDARLQPRPPGRAPGAVRGPLLRGAAGGGRRARPRLPAGLRHGALPGLPSGAGARGARPGDGRRAGRGAAEPAAAPPGGGRRHGARGRLPLLRRRCGCARRPDRPRRRLSRSSRSVRRSAPWTTSDDGPDGEPRRGRAPAPGEPESAYELLQRGQALLARRHHAQAAVVLERAARLEPGRGSILEPLGRAYFMTGQLERAGETFEALLAVDPSSHYGHYALGRTLDPHSAGPTRGGRTCASPSRWRPDSPLYRAACTGRGRPAVTPRR